MSDLETLTEALKLRFGSILRPNIKISSQKYVPGRCCKIQTWLVNGLNTYLLWDERGSGNGIISKNKECLAFLANVLTGLMNLSVDTIFTSGISSLLIMAAYAIALSATRGIIHFAGIRLKFW
ncbi:PREDICTED: uncharacterized protein At4g17910 [Tarenaya hassleriana]|uniref:uncharacterized protein At4g17910 n=1 Tax=Tarenaya hassleriana TaxID=28532 RepID=UPI00053CA3C9|nr:PREDICTED: uncharacterized protein At4g17910 [Tarenaya hassleriana]